jgi:DivIVA domain-containing protein
MSQSEMSDSGTAALADGAREPAPHRPSPQPPGSHEEYAAPLDAERRQRRFRGSGVSTVERDRLLGEVRNIDFAIGIRGYDRGAVDRYVEQVNRLIAELEISSSPESAVRHALDEVSEETRDLLQRAHDTADEITARSRAKADERLERTAAEAAAMLESTQRKAAELRAEAQRESDELRAKVAGETAEMRESAARDTAEAREEAAREAAEVRDSAAREATELRDAAAREAAVLRDAAESDAQQVRAAAQRDAEELRATARREAEQAVSAAETRARELARNAEAIWRERRRLIDDMRAVGEQLVAIGDAEGRRFTRFLTDELVGSEPSEEEAEAEMPPVGVA